MTQPVDTPPLPVDTVLEVLKYCSYPDAMAFTSCATWAWAGRALWRCEDDVAFERAWVPDAPAPWLTRLTLIFLASSGDGDTICSLRAPNLRHLEIRGTSKTNLVDGVIHHRDNKIHLTKVPRLISMRIMSAHTVMVPSGIESIAVCHISILQNMHSTLRHVSIYGHPTFSGDFGCVERIAIYNVNLETIKEIMPNAMIDRMYSRYYMNYPTSTRHHIVKRLAPGAKVNIVVSNRYAPHPNIDGAEHPVKVHLTLLPLNMLAMSILVDQPPEAYSGILIVNNPIYDEQLCDLGPEYDHLITRLPPDEDFSPIWHAAAMASWRNQSYLGGPT